MSHNFNRLYNRHRVSLADERVIANLSRLLRNSRNQAESRQRTDTMRRVYKEFEQKYSWMYNFIKSYKSLQSHRPVNWVRQGKRISTTFTYRVIGWESIFDVISGDFVGASEGFYDPVLHGTVKCVLTIRSKNGVIKIVSSFINLLDRINALKNNFRSQQNQDTVVSGDISNDENEEYTVVLKFITDRFNFQSFLDTLHDFGL